MKLLEMVQAKLPNRWTFLCLKVAQIQLLETLTQLQEAMMALVYISSKKKKLHNCVLGDFAVDRIISCI